MASQQLFSANDIMLLGYENAQEIPELSGKDSPHQCFSAELNAGLRKVSSMFIYLKSHCTRIDIEKLRSRLPKSNEYYVLVPPSLKITNDSIKEILGRNIQIFNPEHVIWEKIFGTFKNYINSLKDNQGGIARESYFVAPRAENLPPTARLDEELLKCFSAPSTTDHRDVIVICASAGVGKTTVSRKIVLDLARTVQSRKLIPIYVEARHWDKLKLDSISEMWEIIDNSIHSYSNINLSQDLFFHALKQGHLVFVFDGFDELCGQKHGQFNAQEEIDRLAGLAKNSDAKILITTRTLYWESEITTVPENVKTYHLSPFNSAQAKDYFDKKFKQDREKYQRACSLYSEIIRSNVPKDKGGPREQFVNLPLVVGMISTYVDHGGTSFSANGYVISDLIKQMCEREIQRKGLATDTIRQIKSFEDLAVYKMDQANPMFNLQDFGMTAFEESDIPKLIDHILLEKRSGSHTFAFDFYPQYLRASFLAEKIKSKRIEDTDVWRIMHQEGNGKSYILEHLLPLVSTEILEEISYWYKNVPVEFPDAKSFLYHLARATIEAEAKSSHEKTILLFSILDQEFAVSKSVRRGNFIGQFEKLDLRDISFIDCVFKDVSFNRCQANDNTKFTRCRFSGSLDFPNSPIKEWSQVQLSENTVLPPTNIIWEEILEEGRFHPRREDHVRDALKLALNKFWHSGRLKATLRRDDWHKGTLGHSYYCRPILDAMLRVGLLEKIEISGVPEGGLSFSHSSVEDLQKFMDNGILTGKIKQVAETLLKK